MVKPQEKTMAITRIKELWFPNTTTLQLWLAILAFSAAIISFLWWSAVAVLDMWGIGFPTSGLTWLFGLAGLFFMGIFIAACISLLVIFIRSCIKMKQPKGYAESVWEEMQKQASNQSANTDKASVEIGDFKITIECKRKAKE